MYIYTSNYTPAKMDKFAIRLRNRGYTAYTETSEGKTLLITDWTAAGIDFTYLGKHK